MKAIFGRKVGMTRIFGEDGRSVPVTVLELGPNVVHQVKTVENDGYSAVQIGIGTQKPQRLTKPLSRHMAKAKKGFSRHLREIRLDEPANKADGASYSIGDEITVAGMFEPGTRVDVVGTSIGKGFAGVMKRHKMAGFTASHGTHEYFRHGGSIGCRKFPGRVFKNKRMAGHMGVDRVVQQGLEVVAVRPDENVLLVKGSVPGPKNGIVFVRSAVKGG